MKDLRRAEVVQRYLDTWRDWRGREHLLILSISLAPECDGELEDDIVKLDAALEGEAFEELFGECPECGSCGWHPGGLYPEPCHTCGGSSVGIGMPIKVGGVHSPDEDVVPAKASTVKLLHEMGVISAREALALAPKSSLGGASRSGEGGSEP